MGKLFDEVKGAGIPEGTPKDERKELPAPQHGFVHPTLDGSPPRKNPAAELAALQQAAPVDPRVKKGPTV